MIAIVGGGVSGLSLAFELQQRGKNAVVLESSARPGGLVASRSEAGYLTETGPNSILDREPSMRGLVEMLGLTPEVRAAAASVKRRFVFTRGAPREVPSSPPAVLRSSMFSFGAKLRLLTEPLIRRRASDEDESLAAFGRRHFGHEVTTHLLDAFQQGIFAGDPERLSVSAAFPALFELEQQHRSLLLGAMRMKRPAKPAPVFTFAGGIEALPAALHQRLGDAVRLHCEVKSLEFSDNDGYRLLVNDRGQSETLEPEQVVLAVPSYEAARLLLGLHGELANELNDITFAPVTVVHIGFSKADVPTPPEGFGYLIPEAEGRKMLGAIYVSSVFPHRAPEDSVLFTCLVGGARHPELAAADDGTLLRDVRGELALALGIQAAPSFVEIVRWPRALPQYNVGHEARLFRIDELLAAFPGLHLHGQSYRGVGLNDCVRASAALAARMAPRDD